MDTLGRNRRREERVLKEVPINFGGSSARSVNISPSGMYFEADTPYTVGSEVHFSLDLDTPDGKKVLKCRGEVVRVKPRSGRMGMAVKIHESTIAGT